ncbi:hypothetical protein [Nocardia sp. NPDC057227]|uniref:hypothetical protein n=1 Tax=Nocardia sp. NPDC057227 TaxID=3346056 RepID=UPI003626033B
MAAVWAEVFADRTAVAGREAVKALGPCMSFPANAVIAEVTVIAVETASAEPAHATVAVRAAVALRVDTAVEVAIAPAVSVAVTTAGAATFAVRSAAADVAAVTAVPAPVLWPRCPSAGRVAVAASAASTRSGSRPTLVLTAGA